MSSSDEVPGACPARSGGGGGDEKAPPGNPMTVGSKMLDKGAAMIQSLKPVKQMSQHVCTFALYGHDLSRQIETHHYVHRLNQDFLQAAVYDSDNANARLIGIEYIVSENLFVSLPPEEQKLWHSHAYEIKTALWVNPRVPELASKPELENLAKTYGKFWCTWQLDRGDRLPLGMPALMMSPQDTTLGRIKPEMVKKRDDKYNFSTGALSRSRDTITGPEPMNSLADYWEKHGKGFAVDVVETEMKRTAPFP